MCYRRRDPRRQRPRAFDILRSDKEEELDKAPKRGVAEGKH